MTLPILLEALQAGGWPLVILVIFLTTALAGVRKLWVFGWAYDELKKDRDEWKSTAEKLVIQLDNARSDAEKSIEWALRISKDASTR